MSENKTRYLTVKDWSKYHDWPGHGSWRNMIFHKETNGLDNFKVIKKIGKRVLIDEVAFFKWLEQEGKERL